MNRAKIILGYLVNFILAVLLFLLVSTILIKNNVFNKENVEKVLVNNNYYEKVSNTILEDMQNYMVSSGLPESILNDIYSDVDVKNDVNTFINNIYLGKKTKVNNDKLTDKINSNINNYLTEHNMTITDQKSLKLFVQDLNKIYNNNIYLYNMVNGFINLFAKLNKVINIVIYILIVSIIILLIINIFILKNEYFGSIFMASGFILIFIKMLILDAIMFKNILIISPEFSEIIKIIYESIENDIIITSISLIIIGLLISFIMSITRNKELKKSK